MTKYRCDTEYEIPKLELQSNPSHSGRFTFKIADDTYICSSMNGYKIYNSFERIYETAREESKAIKTVLAMNKIKDRIWLGSLVGLFHIDLDDYTKVIKLDHPLTNIRINNLQKDSKDRLWIATIGNGLLMYENGEISQISTKEGLFSNLINCVFVESDTVLWVGSNKGLSKLTISYDEGKMNIKRVTNISNKDGLPFIFINDICKWNNDIWVATNNGLFGLPSALELPIDQAPSTYINHFKIDNAEQELTDGANLEYNQNNGVIHFNGISYRKPSHGFFRYKLMWGDHPVQYNLTDDRSIRLINLKPGDYTFSVQAKNKYNTWSKPAEINFQIQPHFAQTWWFRTLLMLTILSLLYYIYLKRIQFLKDQQRQTTKLSEAILRTKIAELSTFRNHFNPHFIFNSLNSIQHYIFDRDIEQANFFLSKFSKLIRSSLNLSDEKLISFSKEFKFIKDYLDIEFLRFPDKFEYQITNENELDLEAFLIPPLLLQPIIENVIKHAFKNMEEGLLLIKIKEHNNLQLSIEISDNGSGIQAEKDEKPLDKRNSYGIKIIKDRIALLNLDFPKQVATFEIKNNPDTQGTTAIFVLPKISNV